ncbi:MAG: glycine--tRNA ligase subunit beta [Syntrophomonadaceae bacterium]|jgi:glycyl-tRNA synthetase beta chain|nr:glycine--tRNA ligase subunit beta [Syntrophomonadaceae bacterium]
MAKDLLFELGVEEMPSAYMPKALDDLSQLARKKFDEARLHFSDLKVYGTPRRLTLYISSLEENQQAALIETRGPKKAIAYDKKGRPTKAALGFARGQGVKPEDLIIKEVDGVEYIFASKEESTRPSTEILGDLLQDLVYSLVFPKSMRWAYYNTRFARPIRWILALFGEQVVELQIENIKSGRITFGHRFLGQGPLEVKKASEYFQALSENYVVLDQDERRALIWQQVQDTAQAHGGSALENSELLEEVTYLVEYPQAFFGQFSDSYLEVPPEVLTTSMIEHQRYFPVYEQGGQLMAGFIGVRNGTDYCLDLVRAGNERVIKARLEDALFFWKEDTKKPLEDMVPRLAEVLFHERLGSIMDKVERLSVLASYLGQKLALSSENRIARAAYLCKGDLVSSMVYEFPELQGIMGRYYAHKSGEEAEVSQAIFEHYLPRFAGDQLPQTHTGIVLSLSEKIDNLIGCYAIGIKPSGSQDPYALRRQALGIVNIIIDHELNLDLGQVLAQAYTGFQGIEPEQDMEVTVSEVLDFIGQRLRGVLLEKGLAYDVIDAVLSIDKSNINDIYQRVVALQQFKNEAEFADLMVVFNRSHNLSKKWHSNQVQIENLVDPSELKLLERVRLLQSELGAYIKTASYDQALHSLASLRPAVDEFFNAVMVMVEEEALKNNRLSLLKSIADLSRLIADFSKIVG